MKLFRNVLLKGLALSICLLVQTVSQAETYKVLLLAGQSNMVGQGNFDELDDKIQARVAAIKHRVLLSENGGALKPLTYRSSKPTEKYPFDKKFGPEIMLGVLLAEQYPNETFIFIKHTQGGTSLEGAWNPIWDEKKAKIMERSESKQKMKLFAEHVNNIKTIVSSQQARGNNVEFIGLAWLQGENDAKTFEAANNYNENLNKLVSAYRANFNMQMPFVFAQTNSRYGKKGAAEIVRNKMQEYANSHKNVIMIPTSTDVTWQDYPKHKDNVHYNAAGTQRIGTAMAKALINLHNTEK